jgi:hypothetical protein
MVASDFAECTFFFTQAHEHGPQSPDKRANRLYTVLGHQIDGCFSDVADGRASYGAMAKFGESSE